MLLLLLACQPEPDTKSTAPEAEAPSLGVSLWTDGVFLTDDADLAVAAVPPWLRADLALSLDHQDDETQDTLAALILEAADPRYVDEIAFVIAHLSPEVLNDRSFYPQLIAENAALIYARDADLDYVALVEESDGDDTWTTATYQVVDSDGATVARTLERDTYYWFVVHPRIEDERPYYIDAWATCNDSDLECPVSPEEGTFWRDFLWDKADDTCPEGRTCPVLADTLAGVDTLWKSKAYSMDDNGAIGALTGFVLTGMDFGALSERSVQPNRIYGLGHGNCGEHSDITTAAARTALIPTWNVGAWGNDHTWNEFWDDGWMQWEPVNVYVGHWYYYADANHDYYRSWDRIDNDCDGVADEGSDTSDSDGDGITVLAGDCDDTRADVYPGQVESTNLIDDDCDGWADDGSDATDADADGYSIAAGDCDDTNSYRNPGMMDPVPSNNRVYATSAARGDAFITQRTEDYGKPFTLEVSVTDSDGVPIDGALVSAFGPILVYAGYEDYWWYVAESVTGPDGIAHLSLGEANAYAIRVDSAIGSWPEDQSSIVPIIDWSEPDVTVNYDVTIDTDAAGTAMPGSLPFTAITPPEGETTSVNLSFNVGDARVEAESYMNGDTFRHEVSGGYVDRFVVDAENMAKLESGEAFEAIEVAQGVSNEDVTLELPADRTWLLVLANTAFSSTHVVGDIAVETTSGALSQHVALAPGRWFAVELYTE